ncbi:uncharacterized protein N0V89_000434 [Didymosphaeria variabile]|uniref:Rhodopsin domain-containing protein n=1 Tax=Didymosphaeria variabile TaxID=1932322 RepID=A0A9W8XUP3_9PLEO|nr:uncharacterized protein N0V89_000434 [Didymosphaeria variabile]KAJ4359878.1 hypothetical protein N0V89_000434 [Didymosphaeria variabile]
MKEGLITKNITTSLCDAPIRDESGSLKAINILMAILSIIPGTTRYAYKIITPGQSLDPDDLSLMVSSYVGLACAIVIDRGAIPSGLGRDIWTLDFSSITNFGKYFYIMEIVYFVELTFLKLSLLFFYKKIFPYAGVQKLLWGTIAFNIMFGVAFTTASIFQCQPIRYYWTKWDGEQKSGKCLNFNALAWANAAISIAVDFWMLAIPLSQIVHLKMAARKKIAVTSMFLVGTFVTVVSILRLQSLVAFANSTNPTWDQWDVTRWSVIEINVGITCACMPTLRVLLARCLPKMFGPTADSSNRYPQQHVPRKGTGGESSPHVEFIDIIIDAESDLKSGERVAVARNKQPEDDEIELVKVGDK